jgi:hypothetical protein
MHGVPLGDPWQVPPWQFALAQSALLRHVRPFPHAGQLPPPQSMSVSLPFLTASEQVGG